MWFKVDDGFFRHPKTLDAAERLGDRWQIGRVAHVWLEAGTWAAHALTDGFVPDMAVETFVSDRRAGEVMEACAEAGLFIKRSTGYQFHDWDHYNPTAQGVKDKREKDRQRKRLGKGTNGHAPQALALFAESDETIDGIVVDSYTIPNGVGEESRALARARSRPVPSPERSKAGEHHAPKPRMARVPYAIWEIRNHLLAAVYTMLDQGAPYITADGDVDILAIDDGLKALQRQFPFTWEKSRELQLNIDSAVARRKKQLAGGRMKRYWEQRERRLLTKLGRFR